jgi:hypothetical protein
VHLLVRRWTDVGRATLLACCVTERSRVHRLAAPSAESPWLSVSTASPAPEAKPRRKTVLPRPERQSLSALAAAEPLTAKQSLLRQSLDASPILSQSQLVHVALRKGTFMRTDHPIPKLSPASVASDNTYYVKKGLCLKSRKRPSFAPKIILTA